MTADGRRIVFISCGQYVEEERQLGKALADLVEAKTPFRGYFAENQMSFEAVTQNILAALNDCAGFVAVIHRRGEVSTLGSKHNRGSVWVEQEIAIAAFLVQVMQKKIPVALYIQNGIKREGLREQVLLNPVTFQTGEDVVKHFTTLLDGGVFSARPVIQQTAEQLVQLIDNAQSFFALDQDGSRTPDYFKLIAAPRASVTLDLDTRFHDRFGEMIESAFPETRGFDRDIAQGQYYQLEDDQAYRSSTSRRWIALDSGSLGYTANLLRTAENPVGDLVCDYLFFLRLAQQFFGNCEITGNFIFSAFLTCRSARFSPFFPAPDGHQSDYDLVTGLRFPASSVYRHETSRVLRQIAVDSLPSAAPEMVSDIIRSQLAETWEARIDSAKLRESVEALGRQISHANWGKTR